MPLVRIDVNAGPQSRRAAALSRGIHDAILAEYGIPERDYFHIVTEHPAGQIVAQDAGLGFERTPEVVMIQIFTQGGRSQEAKQALFAAVAASWRTWGLPARTSSSATWKTQRGTGRSDSAAPSTSRASWRSRGSSIGRCPHGPVLPVLRRAYPTF